MADTSSSPAAPSTTTAACPTPGCSALVQLNEEHCHTCGAHTGFPNVKLADSQRAALHARAVAARDSVIESSRATLVQFEGALGVSHATVTVSALFATTFLASIKNMYTSYAAQVDAGVRRPASPLDDRSRREVECRLYGNDGNKILYAALALDGGGLPSYGEVALRIRDHAVKGRASVLEDNSFEFSAAHRETRLPDGYLGVWGDRSEVAVAKHARDLTPSMTDDELAALLIQSDGGRSSDKFIEVHIWGAFSREAVQSIQDISAPTDEETAHYIALAKSKASQLGIDWVRHERS